MHLNKQTKTTKALTLLPKHFMNLCKHQWQSKLDKLHRSIKASKITVFEKTAFNAQCFQMTQKIVKLLNSLKINIAT